MYLIFYTYSFACENVKYDANKYTYISPTINPNIGFSVYTTKTLSIMHNDIIIDIVGSFTDILNGLFITFPSQLPYKFPSKKFLA
jgi:hypothetical protein